jgi:hypothetical protein
MFPPTEMLWSGGPYRLWKLAENWIVINDIRNPNGVEDWRGTRGFWIGTGDTEIELISSKNGRVIIEGQFIRGPSLPERSDRRMLIFSAQGYQTSVSIIENGRQTLSVPVSLGKNQIFFRALDEPTLTRLPDGDTRPLLFGVYGLRIVEFEAH